MIVRLRASPGRSDELEERERALGLLGRQFDGELIAKDVEDGAGILGNQDGLSLSDVGRFHNRYPFPALRTSYTAPSSHYCFAAITWIWQNSRRPSSPNSTPMPEFL